MIGLTGGAGVLGASLDVKACIATHNPDSCAGAALGLGGAVGGMAADWLDWAMQAKLGFMGAGEVAALNDLAAADAQGAFSYVC